LVSDLFSEGYWSSNLALGEIDRCPMRSLTVTLTSETPRIERIEMLFSEIPTLSLPKGRDPYSDKKVSGNCFRLEC
jgi:hypothetical protein